MSMNCVFMLSIKEWHFLQLILDFYSTKATLFWQNDNDANLNRY